MNFMDINDLIEEQKMKIIANEFMRNYEYYFQKFEEIVKCVNKNNIF